MIQNMMRRAMASDDSTLSLDFTTGVLDPRLTFTRSTSATYIGADGLVKTMAAAPTNDPTKARFDYDPTTLSPRGLLVEGSATSLSRSSQDLTNAAYWTLQTAYASTSATGGTAPDGTNTGNLFTEPSTNLQRSIYQSYSSAAGTYTFSVWLKAGSGSTRYMRLVVSSGASDFGYVTINMSTGAVQQAATAVGTATNASATVSGNYTATGWRRCSLTVTLAASVNFVFLVPIDLAFIDTPTTNYGRVSYLGDGSSFLVWGAQLEAGSGASSYIPTGASQGSRAADVCYIANSDYGFSTSGGTYLAEWHRGSNITTGSTGNNAFATDYASGRWLGIYTTGAGSTGTAGSWSGYLNSSGAVAGINKMAVSYSSWVASASGNASLNGGAIVSGTLTLGTTPTYLFIGAASATSPYNGGGFRDPLNNCVRQIKYWPSVLPNAQLQSLTT